MRISIGEVDGDGWEDHCRRLLKIKYQAEGYQNVPAKFGGDLGIEGFTLSGIAFQCYCPDGNPPAKKLYELQRDKITKDIGKLVKNEVQLIGLIGQVKINEWQFLTPDYESKELLEHCRKKEKEVSEKGCAHIAEPFRVLVKTEEDFIPERALLVNSNLAVIRPNIPDIGTLDVQKWENSNNDLYDNLKRKLSKIGLSEEKLLRSIETNIKAYLSGQNVLEQIRTKFPAHYEQIRRAKAVESQNVEYMSTISTDSPSEQLKQCLAKYEEVLRDTLGGSLDTPATRLLVHEAPADWLIRCPLDF